MFSFLADQMTTRNETEDSRQSHKLKSPPQITERILIINFATNINEYFISRCTQINIFQFTVV